eukprot:6064627-Amphidinium_carterae.1
MFLRRTRYKGTGLARNRKRTAPNISRPVAAAQAIKVSAQQSSARWYYGGMPVAPLIKNPAIADHPQSSNSTHVEFRAGC